MPKRGFAGRSQGRLLIEEQLEVTRLARKLGPCNRQGRTCRFAIEPGLRPLGLQHSGISDCKAFRVVVSCANSACADAERWRASASTVIALAESVSSSKRRSRAFVNAVFCSAKDDYRRCLDDCNSAAISLPRWHILVARSPRSSLLAGQERICQHFINHSKRYVTLPVRRGKITYDKSANLGFCGPLKLPLG